MEGTQEYVTVQIAVMHSCVPSFVEMAWLHCLLAMHGCCCLPSVSLPAAASLLKVSTSHMEAAL